MLPSAAAGISGKRVNGADINQSQTEPLSQKSMNAAEGQGKEGQSESNPVLSRKLLATKKSLGKKEAELAAVVQQLRAREEKIIVSEQKIQNLERTCKAQAAQVQSLKMEMDADAGSANAEQVQQLLNSIEEANSQLCGSLESDPQVLQF